MRILLTTDTVGGVWDHALALAGELAAGGHEVLLAVIGELSPERAGAVPAGVQVTARAYRLEWMPGAADDLAPAAQWLGELAQLWGAEVVHLNQLAYAAWRFRVPVVTAAHSDVLSWWAAVEGGEAPAEWREYAGWVREGLAASSAVVAPTCYQAGLLWRWYGYAGARVIHNGVVPPAEEPSSADEPPPEAPLVLCVGRAWDRGKGVDLLGDAAARLGTAAPEIHVLGEIAAPHGGTFAAPGLRLHGRVERGEVDAWMRRAALYVAPSRYEPFGLAPLEAALHGCALLLSDLPSFRELWDGCAAFFPSGDAGALAESLAELLADPVRVARLAGSARTRALRRYGAERMAAEYLSLYRELTAGSHAQRSVA